MLFTVDNNILTPASRSAANWLSGQTGTVDLSPVSKITRRSLDANAKYWAWCRQIEAELGWEPGDAHRWQKWQWGLAILTEKHPEYRDRLMAMLRPLPYEQRLAAMDLISCTSQFSVEEMQRLMDTAQRHWASQGIALE